MRPEIMRLAQHVKTEPKPINDRIGDRPVRARSWHVLMAVMRLVVMGAILGTLPWWGMPFDTAMARSVQYVNLLGATAVLIVTLSPQARRAQAFWYLVPLLDIISLSATVLTTGGASSPFHWAILGQVLGATFMFGPTIGALNGAAFTVLLIGLDAVTRHPRMIDDLMLTLMVWGGFAGFVYLNDVATRASQEAKAQKARAQELQSLNDAKYQFINIVSHELRTPLTVINGYSKLLRSQTIGQDPEELLDVSKEISKAADRMGLLIEELLDFGRLQSGQLPMRPEIFDLAGLAQDVSHVLGVLAGQKEQRIILEAQVSGASVYGDPRRLEQVLINLLHNALKYSPEKTEVRLVVRTLDDRIRAEVIDRGPGIAPEHQAHLFTPFFRAGLGTRRVDVEGIGLGLAICQGIVQAHDGDIGVESTPGNGSVFWFELPLAEEAVVPLDEIPRDRLARVS